MRENRVAAASPAAPAGRSRLAPVSRAEADRAAGRGKERLRCGQQFGQRGLGQGVDRGPVGWPDTDQAAIAQAGQVLRDSGRARPRSPVRSTTRAGPAPRRRTIASRAGSARERNSAAAGARPILAAPARVAGTGSACGGGPPAMTRIRLSAGPGNPRRCPCPPPGTPGITRPPRGHHRQCQGNASRKCLPRPSFCPLLQCIPENGNHREMARFPRLPLKSAATVI